ncbi:MAG TPA: hypothetical protein P5075_00735 [Eubacteriales bacterium]|nr:hypothetical protein [Eubacteriales bacterium]
MEQNSLSKCFRCGGESQRLFAFARLSDKEAFLGVTDRAVCDACLAKYVEEVKSGKKGRYNFLGPLIPMTVFGTLLAVFAESGFWVGVGVLLLLGGAAAAAAAVVEHKREVKTAREADAEENMKKYAPKMCLEDARKSGQQGKLVEMKLEYATDKYPIEKIAKEAKVSVQTATMIKLIILKAFAATLAQKGNAAN